MFIVFSSTARPSKLWNRKTTVILNSVLNSQMKMRYKNCAVTSGLQTGCGGGEKSPHSIFLLWYTSITFNSFLESPWAINNLKKANLQSSNQAKMCQKNCANCNRLYIFEKPLTQQIQMCKNIWKYSKPKCVFKKNWKCANSLWRRLCKKLCKISLQNFCNLLAVVIGFPKSYAMLKSNDRK